MAKAVYKNLKQKFMKRIITCSDGTWNKPNLKVKGKVIKTNVQKIFDCINNRDRVHDIAQVKYYDEGIGARGSTFSKIFAGATGRGIDQNILDAYKFICWNYDPGDQIYLFGFSRGAYTARSLGGLIRKSGIIKLNDLDLISEAYELYRNRKCVAEDPAAREFRAKNSHDVSSIRFIGVWDTVGSLGLPLTILQWYNRRRYSFYDTKLSSIIEYAYHALAVDERRGVFEPTLWQKSDNQAKNLKQVLEQRWFPGVHSNVGGGYPDDSLSNIALKWLFKKAMDVGLSVNHDFLLIPDNYEGTLYNSCTGLYSLMSKRARKIEVDNIESFVDDSVYERMRRMGAKYRPSNVPDRAPQ